MAKQQTKAQYAALLKLHDKAVAELDRVTSKPLAELTRAEFDYLAHRFFIPQGESPLAKQRRQFVNQLCGDEQHARWAVAKTKTEATGKLHVVTQADYEGAVFKAIQAGQYNWPA